MIKSYIALKYLRVKLFVILQWLKSPRFIVMVILMYNIICRLPIIYAETTTLILNDGGECLVREQTDFDKVFNKENAPGYWKNNEYLEDDKVIIVEKSSPESRNKYPPHDISQMPYGLGHASKAHIYASKIHQHQNAAHGNSWTHDPTSSEIVLNNDDLDFKQKQQKFLNDLRELSLHKQSQAIAQHLFEKVTDVLDEYKRAGASVNINDIVHLCVYDDVTQVFWEMQSLDDSRQETLCASIVGMNNQVILDNNNELTRDQREILAHISAHMACKNISLTTGHALNRILQEKELYNMLYNQQFLKYT